VSRRSAWGFESEGGAHPKANACSRVSSHFGAHCDRAHGSVDPADDRGLRRDAGADRRDGLVSAHALAGGAARAAGVGCRTDAYVGGRDDRRGVDDTASRLAQRPTGRIAAVGVAGGWQYSKPCCKRRSRTADHDGPGDRRVAVVLTDRRIRAADAPGPPCGGDCHFQARAETVSRAGARHGRAAERTTASGTAASKRGPAGRDVRLDAWQWAQDNRADDGSLPTGRDIANRYGRHERWGRLVKRSGVAGELGGVEQGARGKGNPISR
jgi:hypothetical protein